MNAADKARPPVWWRWAGGVLLALVGAGCGSLVALAGEGARSPLWPVVLGEVRRRFPEVQAVSTADLAAALADPEPARRPLLLDARAAAEFALSRLPGAVWAPDAAAARAVLAEVPPARPVVVYCSVGWRSAALINALDAEFPGLQNLEGSLFRWANEGRPLEGPGGAPADRVHPFDQVWGRLLEPSLRATEKTDFDGK